MRRPQLLVAAAPALAVILAELTSPRVWAFLAVPAGPTPFVDLSTVAAATDCRRHGYDVLVENPCDLAQRPMNYPRVWSALGFDHKMITAAGIVLAVLLAASIWALLVHLEDRQVWQVIPFAISPAVLLLAERGNIESLAFGATVVAVLLLGTGRPTLAGASIALGSAAKLLPVLTLGTFPREARRIVVAVAAVLGVWLLLTYDDLRKIADATPRTVPISFGARVPWQGLADGYGPLPSLGSQSHVPLLHLLTIAAAAAIGFALSAYVRPIGTEVGRRAFWGGFPILAVAYAQGNSFDYRLVFALLVLPLLLEVGPVGALGAVALVVPMWLSPRFSVNVFPLDSTLMFVAVTSMSAVAIRHAPPLLRTARRP